MDEQRNRECIQRFYDCVNRRAYDELGEYLHPDYVDHNHTGDLHGIPSFRDYIANFMDGFSDGRFEILDIVAENDFLAWRTHFTGTNDCPLRGAPATRNRVDVYGVQMCRFTDDVLGIEHWVGNDLVVMLEQLRRGDGAEA